jgi:hypothetical protein
MQNHRLLGRVLPAVAMAASLSFGLVNYAAAAPSDQIAAPVPGEVLRLQGTDHLWVIDPQGVAHLASGPAALAGKAVDWSDVTDASVNALRALPQGAPYLSADLVKIGDSIYVPQFRTDGAAPTLLRVQSIDDLALFGITDANYSQLVLDAGTWQQRYGVDPAQLPADEFRLFPAPVLDADLDSSNSAQVAETVATA